MVLYRPVLFYRGGGASLLFKENAVFYERVKGFVLNIWEGIMSLKGVRNIPLFIFYTLAIWACYFFISILRSIVLHSLLIWAFLRHW